MNQGAIPSGYTSLNGELAIAGHTASHWVAIAEDTPLFLYDRRLIDQRIAELRAALPSEVELHYAIKANPLPELVNHIAAQVDGLDVASAGELELALASGMTPDCISFAGPAKRDRELRAAVQAGVTVNIESEGEFTRLAAIGKELDIPPVAAVRVNPPFDVKASGMKMGGGAKPFGIDAARVPALLACFDDAGVRFDGFHIFAGSQNLSADALIEVQARALELASDLALLAPCPPRIVNIGGGFGIPYFMNDKPLDLHAVGAALGMALAERSAVLRAARIVIELGRYIVGEAGVYLTRVVDRKQSHGETFILVDGGLHHQLAASGNFGTVIRRNYPIANASRFDKAPEEVVTVSGCLCTPIDRLGDKVSLPRTEVGDLIAVFMAGAYGRSASPTSFLGHPPPCEMLV